MAKLKKEVAPKVTEAEEIALIEEAIPVDEIVLNVAVTEAESPGHHSRDFKDVK